VPLEGADRIELVDNTSSSLYGNYAMGGVINIVTEPARRRTVEFKTLYGSRQSPQFDVRASDIWGKASVTFSATAFDTDGYAPVAENERGKVDNNADVTYHDLNFKVDYAARENLKLTFRTGTFREERDNGKASTIDGTEEANDTRWTTVSGGVDWRLANQNHVQATLFGDIETFRSNFLAVPAATPPRSIGRMTLNQRVPTDGFGGMAQWSRPFWGTHLITAGTDWRWVEGESQEDGLDATTGTQVTLQRFSGGTQRSIGAFVQDVIMPTSSLNITLSARVDNWRNYNGHNIEKSYPSGIPTANNAPTLPSRSDTVGSPRVAALYHLTSRARVWGDIGWGFRAPTLNELYRQFRVGTVLTLANYQLGPERLVGGELGFAVEPVKRLTSRLTWFDNRVQDPISNVTIATQGANVTQQRQNLGRTHIRGVQMDAEYAMGPYWRVGGGYFYNLATVTEFAANPTLVGKYLPQVPKHRGSVQVVYSNPRLFTLAFSLQAVGNQFDDDQNSRIVPGYTTPGLPKFALFDISASRTLGHGVDVFFAAQNLFDQTYYVGTLPTTVGSPRFVSGGVRIKISGK
jgi:iron complex outermembrane receptor protein